MTDELIEQVARAICASNGCEPDTRFEGSPIWVDWAEDARAALAAINLPALTAWREAVIDELCSLHIYSAEHDADPRKAVRDIIKWNQHLALDPAVSAEARALHTQGWNEAIFEALAEVITEKTIEQHGAHCRCATCELNVAEAGIRALTKENSDASSD